MCLSARTGGRHGEMSHGSEGRHGEMSHGMEQQSRATTDDARHTPAIKLRIKIGRDTVIGTKRCFNNCVCVKM